MASNYPGSVDSNTQVTDGVDIIQAQDINLGYDSSDATQTFIGTIGTGKTQSHSIDILNFLSQNYPRAKLSYVDADTVQVSAGWFFGQNSGATIRLMRKNTSTTNVTFTSLDTGSRAQDTTYYVWANFDATATTVTFTISESSSAPTGVTTYQLVGKFATNTTGSGQVIETSVASFVGTEIVNIQYSTDTSHTTGTTAIVNDDSIPQITEGDQFLALDYLPMDSNNILHVEAVIKTRIGANTGGQIALYKDGASNAIAAAQNEGSSGGTDSDLRIDYLTTAGTTDLISYTVRAGDDSGDTFSMNGANGSRLLGGVQMSYIKVTEYRKVFT